MAPPDPLVRVEHLTKTFRLFESPFHRLGARFGWSEPRLVTPVADVSFEVPAGSGFGIVGENGAGKTTLLRMVAGTVRPTSGQRRVTGRIGSILELGSAFHPELSGRQNIRLSAALAGLDPQEVAARTEEIIAFSELGAFIDEPVKCYSSGMVVRLAFAVATRSDPDVLVVDEALAVGDGRFQKRCLDRIRTFLDAGGALVLCSHALYYVTSLCESAIWLRHGRVAAQGPASDVAREYETHLRRDQAPSQVQAADPGEVPERDVRIVEIRMLAATAGDGVTVPRYSLGDRWGVEVVCTSRRPEQGLHLGLSVDTVEGREVFAFATHRDGLRPASGSTRHAVRLWVPALPLLSGEFTLRVFALDESGLHVYDRKALTPAFRVAGREYSPALVDPPREWEWPGEGHDP